MKKDILFGVIEWLRKNIVGVVWNFSDKGRYCKKIQINLKYLSFWLKIFNQKVTWSSGFLPIPHLDRISSRCLSVFGVLEKLSSPSCFSKSRWSSLALIISDARAKDSWGNLRLHPSQQQQQTQQTIPINNTTTIAPATETINQTPSMLHCFQRQSLQLPPLGPNTPPTTHCWSSLPSQKTQSELSVHGPHKLLNWEQSVWLLLVADTKKVGDDEEDKDRKESSKENELTTNNTNKHCHKYFTLDSLDFISLEWWLTILETQMFEKL